MSISRTFLVRALVLTVVCVVVVVALVAARPYVEPVVVEWFQGHKKEDQVKSEDTSTHELVRDATGRPVRPYVIRVKPEVVRALKVTYGKAEPAGLLPLPAQIGTLGYDIDRLYPIRPRFQGEVIQIKEVTDYLGPTAPVQERVQKRLLGPGDRVEKGDVLAVYWSKEIADRKVALVTALLDQYLDEANLRKLEEYSGTVPPVTLRAARTKVEKDQAAVYQAESSLGVARLTPQEIEEIRAEAKTIQKRLQGKPETPEQRQKRIQEDVQRWARVELVAPHGGVVVEKNTNVNDIVDPSKDTPLFRIADLGMLMIFVNFNEEYLPILQPLMAQQEDLGRFRWKVKLEALPEVPVLDLPILRIAPSLNPDQHTATVIGRISNPVKDRNGQDRHLVVGQFVTATVLIPPGPNLVAIPTDALNEVNGESLVFVRRSVEPPEFEQRGVVVVRRSKDFTLVRGELTPEEQKASEEEVRQGRRPFGVVRSGEVLVTRGVTELTDALDALISKARAEQ
jgi:cobalt-zinc-cadmium efflux system membrane fusion protein